MTWKARRGVLTSTAARGGAGGGGNSAEVTQFFSRISATSAPYTAAYIALIDGIVAAGAWNDIESLGVFAAPDEATALVDVKASNAFTKVAEIGTGLVFTAGVGFNNTDVSNRGAIDTDIAVATSSLYSRNSAHFGVYYASIAGGGSPISGWLNAGATAGAYVSPNKSSTKTGNMHGDFDIDDDTAAGDLTGEGYVLSNRSGSSATELYVNGALVDSGTEASLDVSAETLPFWILSRNFNGSANQTDVFNTASFFTVGRTLSGGKVSSLNTLFAAFLAAVP